MTTATLTFRLPRDAHEHECALRGGEACALIQELASRIRARLKHGAALYEGRDSTPVSDDERDALESVAAWLSSEARDRGLTVALEWY